MFEAVTFVPALLFSILKDFFVENLPDLGPLILIILVLGLLKLMIDEILSTKIGTTLVLGCVIVFLVNQGVF